MAQKSGNRLRLALLLLVLVGASTLSLAPGSDVAGSAQQSEDALLRLAAQLPPNMSLIPLAADRVRWSPEQLDCDFMTCILWMSVERVALQPGASREVTAGSYIGGASILYSEDQPLTFSYRTGSSENVGPDEHALVGSGETVQIVNNTRSCATLIDVSLTLQAGVGAGVPPPVGSGPQLPLTSADRCSGEPESFYMTDSAPAEHTLVFVARLIWHENWEPGMGASDPFLDPHSHDGPVAIVVDSGLLSVFGGGPATHVADGWVEIRPETVVQFMRITAIEEPTTALFIGAVNADEEILLPPPQ